MAKNLVQITTNPIGIMTIIVFLLIFLGMLMEDLSLLVIMGPLLMPIVLQVGIDPVHFGVIMVLNLMIGLLTPPVGMVLYVLSRVAGISFERCSAATLPFLFPLVAVLAIITFVPIFSMWLPKDKSHCL